ncbi:alpha/beta hydrolase [Accumulibacter sp.]|uniref:alpha/beta hydrolase n=1 Tax=Accumulibacter sp. TaxID=2053492 RepID=UPI002BF216FD|nr:alpha/beta hydrolase [Accumulibacter sp.]HNE38924.1 alpha/beta hydrolase [Accumulibacter sp.]
MSIASAVLAGLIFLAGVAMFQDHLLYYPERASVEEMQVVSRGLAAWPTVSDFRGLLAEPDVPARATVIVFHGNAGHAGHRDYYAEALAPLGLRVLLAEYPAYGPRAGSLGETSLVADAERTISLARELYRGPLLIIGESLGAGVAAAVSARQRDAVAGVLLVTPWDKLENVARHHYPLLPVRSLLRDRYDSVTNLVSFGRPVFVAVAERDRIIPAHFGQALEAALAPPKRLSIIAGADHNDWLLRVDDHWWQAAIDFLLAGEAGRSPG